MEPPNLSINVYTRPIDGGTFLYRLNQPEGYSHTILANGGYWNASFTLPGRIVDMDDWITNGLGRLITVYDDTLSICWQGFVNEVEAVYGPLTVKHGPLLGIANQVQITYSTVDTTTSPPTVGLRATTAAINDTTSQALFGIIPKMLSTGGATPVTAVQITTTYLAEHARPETTKTWAGGGQMASAPSLTVSCVGAAQWLMYPYNYTASSGAVNASAKIVAIIAANPNIAWLPFTGSLATNTLQVQRWENDYNLAWDLIMEVVAQGDAANARWLFGVYEDYTCRYEAAPTTVEYHQRLTDAAQRITLPTGAPVPPWRVLPGKWLLFPDLLVGGIIPTDLKDDPRSMFIESVAYTQPFGLELQGGSTDTLKQMLGQMGLAGVGA